MESILHCNMRAVAAFGLLIFLVTSAHPETKPQISINTRAAEITVTVDAGLRKHPGLYENCLAEGQALGRAQPRRGRQGAQGEPGVFPGRSPLDVRAALSTSAP